VSGKQTPQEEFQMATTKSKAKKTATTKKANGKGAAKSAPRKESKAAKVVALLRRPSGCTREQVLEVTGWKAVSMQQQAAAAGLKLKIDDSEKPYRYRAEG
jgi:hypothetical protein